MAEFTVTISAMNSASGETKNRAEAFREAANAMLQATQSLTETGWDDDASKVFLEKITELKTWCDTMGGIIDTYSEALNKISGSYSEADQQAANQFKR
jgi:WXG100 family type VII secretion target